MSSVEQVVKLSPRHMSDDSVFSGSQEVTENIKSSKDKSLAQSVHDWIAQQSMETLVFLLLIAIVVYTLGRMNSKKRN